MLIRFGNTALFDPPTSLISAMRQLFTLRIPVNIESKTNCIDITDLTNLCKAKQEYFMYYSNPDYFVKERGKTYRELWKEKGRQVFNKHWIYIPIK